MYLVTLFSRPTLSLPAPYSTTLQPIRSAPLTFRLFFSNSAIGGVGCAVVSSHSQVKSSLRLFRPPLTQTQRGLQDHKNKFTKQNKSSGCRALANSPIMSTLTAHCQWKDETVRERTGHTPSYAVAKKMKSLTLHIHGKGRPSPKANDAIFPYLTFPPISEHLSESMKNCLNLTFFPKNYVFAHKNF